MFQYTANVAAEVVNLQIETGDTTGIYEDITATNPTGGIDVNLYNRAYGTTDAFVIVAGYPILNYDSTTDSITMDLTTYDYLIEIV